MATSGRSSRPSTTGARRTWEILRRLYSINCGTSPQYSRRKHVGLAPVLERGSPQPPDGSETRERVPGCCAVRSEGKAWTVRNRCAAGRRLRRRKRSDIRVSFNRFDVPVEIKRSCHPDVWAAVRSQLIAKYTREPRAAGHGIYLVFWFGATEKCRPTRCLGWTPETAEDVRLRIQQSLDDREGRLISVCVVDVSTPQ